MESDEELDLNLEVLNEQERNIIVNVLKRDEVLRKVQDFKIGELKVEIQNIRQKGIMRGDDDISRMCVRCRAELGRLFNRGSLCPQCHFRVCLMCQEKLFNGSILCTLCYKLRQLKWLTGEWGSGGHTRLRRWSSGADLVKSTLSLPKNILIGNTRADDDSIIPGNTRLSQQSEPNGSALPSENNDDDKVHYPQDSDRRKLTELFDSFFAKHPESATREKHSRSVKHISTRIYEDSDSSSTASDAETPFVNIPSAQSFTVLKDDDTPLAHSFPSAHSLPANAISTPVNRGRFVDGTADFTGSEKKKVHAPKLSFSDASRPSFDASEDRSSFLASPIIKNQSHNMNNSLQDSVFSQSDSKSEFPFGPRQTGAHACLTASEAVMAMKMAKQLESTPVQSNSASPMHDGRTESPTECTMESLPSSHASSPISVRNARLSSSEMKTKQESSDTDSLSKISQDGEFSGTESLPREGPDADDFVVEQISKVHFQRMSRKAAQCSVPSSTHKSREHASPEVQQYCDSVVDCAISEAFSDVDQHHEHAHTPNNGASENNIDLQAFRKENDEEQEFIEISVKELSEMDNSHAVLKPYNYKNLSMAEKKKTTSDNSNVPGEQSFYLDSSLSEISEITSEDCDLSAILPADTSSTDPYMLTFLGTDLVWDEGHQNIFTRQDLENRLCKDSDRTLTDSVFTENISYDNLWVADRDSSDGFPQNISLPKSETDISSKKCSLWHFKEDNLEYDIDKLFGETEFINKSKNVRGIGLVVPVTPGSSDSSDILSSITEESEPSDEESKLKQDKSTRTKRTTTHQTLKRTIVDPVKEESLFSNNTAKIPRVESIFGTEKNSYGTLETVIEELGRQNDEPKSDILLNENRNGKRSVHSNSEITSNDVSPIALKRKKQGNIDQDGHLTNIVSENSARGILTSVDDDGSDLTGTSLVPVTHHKTREASVQLSKESEDTELQPVIKVGHYKKHRDRKMKPSVRKLPTRKSTESQEFVKTVTYMKLDEEENGDLIDEQPIQEVAEPMKNTIAESQPMTITDLLSRDNTGTFDMDLIKNKPDGPMLYHTSIASEDGNKSQTQTKPDHPSPIAAMVTSNGRQPVSEEIAKCGLISKNIQANICNQLYCLTGRHGHLYVRKTLANNDVNETCTLAEVNSEIAGIPATQENIVGVEESEFMLATTANKVEQIKPTAADDVIPVKISEQTIAVEVAATEDVIEMAIVPQSYADQFSVRFSDFTPTRRKTNTTKYEDELLTNGIGLKSETAAETHKKYTNSIEEIVEPKMISKRHSDNLAVRFPHFHAGHYKKDVFWDDDIEQEHVTESQTSSNVDSGSSKKPIIEPKCHKSDIVKEEIVEPGILSMRHSDDLANRFPHFHRGRYAEQKTMTNEIVPMVHDHCYSESQQSLLAVCTIPPICEEVLEPPMVTTVLQKKMSLQFPDFHPTQTKIGITSAAKTPLEDATHSAPVKKLENDIKSGLATVSVDNRVSARFTQFSSSRVEYDSDGSNDDMVGQTQIDMELLKNHCSTELEQKKIVREKVIVPFMKRKEDLQIRLPHFHLVHQKEELVQANDSIEEKFVAHSQASSQNVDNRSNKVKCVDPALIKSDFIEEIVEPGIICKRYCEDLAVRFPHFHRGRYKDDKVFCDDHLEQVSLAQLQENSIINGGSSKKEIEDPEYRKSESIKEEIVEPGIISKRYCEDLAVQFPHFHRGRYKDDKVFCDDHLEQVSLAQLQENAIINGESSKKEIEDPEYHKSESIKEEIVEPGIISKRNSDDLAIRYPHFHAARYEEQKTATDKIVPMSHDHCHTESRQHLVAVCMAKKVGEEVLESVIVPISHQEQTIQNLLFPKFLNSNIEKCPSIDGKSVSVSTTVTCEVVESASKKSSPKIRKCQNVSVDEDIVEPGIMNEKCNEQNINFSQSLPHINNEQDNSTPPPIEKKLLLSTSKEMLYESEPMKPPSPRRTTVKDIDKENVELGELSKRNTYHSAHDLQREKADGASDNKVFDKVGCAESGQRICSVLDETSRSNSTESSRSPRKSMDDVWDEVAKKMSTAYSLVKNEISELGTESKSLSPGGSKDKSLASGESEDKSDRKVLKLSLAPLDTPELETIDDITPVNDPDICEMNFMMMTQCMPNSSSLAVRKHSQSDMGHHLYSKDADVTLDDDPEIEFVPGNLSPPRSTVASNLGIYQYQTTYREVQPEKVPVVKMFPSAGSDGSASLEDSGLVSEASHATTPEHQRTDSVNSQSSIPSVTLSIATDHSHEEDDIDSIVASHRSLYSSVGGSHGNLLTTIADSHESIMSFYSNAGDVDYGKIPITGDILFGLDYNYRTGSLEIMIKKCQDIAPVDTKHNRSDPYVKTYLLPDKTRSGKRKTKIKKHTLNPTFDEVLRYVISKSELESRTLWVSVWHNDRFGRNDFLGEITINFDYYKFTDSTPKWYQLHERMDNQHQSVLAYKGDIILSVRYVTSDKLLHEASGSPLPSRKKAKKSNPACSQGELQVLIKEARNLTAVRSNGYSDPFCKGFLLPEAKHKSSKQKTPVIKKDCSPIWNYTLIFDDVSLEELRECCLELSIWDQDRLLGNDFLGGLRLNLGSGSSHGKHVDWMDARGEEISIWQSMLDRPNTWIDGALILRPSMNKRRY